MGIDLRDKNLSILNEGVDVSSGTSSINFAGSGVSVAAVGDDVTVTIPGAAGVTSVSGTAPIVSSGGATPAISMPVSTDTIDGYLSATDWITFKAKQNAITLTTTGSSGAATLIGATLNIPNYDGTPRVQSVTSAATVTPTSLNDLVKITAQAVALTIANPTGTWSEGQSLMIRIKDNATARTITWDTNYRAVGVTLPTTTTLSKTTYVGLIYNSTDSKWDAIGVVTQA